MDVLIRVAVSAVAQWPITAISPTCVLEVIEHPHVINIYATAFLARMINRFPFRYWPLIEFPDSTMSGGAGTHPVLMPPDLPVTMTAHRVVGDMTRAAHRVIGSSSLLDSFWNYRVGFQNGGLSS